MRWPRLTIALLCALFACIASHAQNASDIVGAWVLPMQGKNLMVLKLMPGTPADQITGSYSHPAHFNFDGAFFSGLSRDSTTEQVAGSWKDDAWILVGQDSQGHPSGDKFRVSLNPDGHLAFRLDGIPLSPFLFAKGKDDATVAGDWDGARTYALDDTGISNPEMKRIYDEDQQARQGNPAKIDWKVVGPADEQRRVAVRRLLKDGKLSTGDDFERAAFLFQHGDTSDDFLTAHTLAMIAVARGKPTALWIGAATLDRYLQSTGKPQIYGTQFQSKNEQPTTQEPYNRDLISDALRRLVAVPNLAQQEEQRKQYDADRIPASSAKAPVKPATP